MDIVEWQVFPHYGKHGKITEIEYKIENTENGIFATQNAKYPRKSLFLEYFKVKYINKNLRLVKLLLIFNTNYSLSVNVI